MIEGKSHNEGSTASRTGRKTSDPILENILRNLPVSPGVYQMKDEGGTVIYVGKAKNLRSRVKSYFDRTTDLTLAKKQMVGKIADIEYIVTETEVEALVLETNLIKHLTPKYNILMKDDKNLAYIKIPSGPISEIVKTRKKVPDGSEYFGPFVSGVETVIRALRRAYKVRSCQMKFQYTSPTEESIKITDTAGKKPPCMDYYIGLCPAPCLLTEEKIQEHRLNLDAVRKYLKGEGGDLVTKLEQEMIEKAKKLDFEEAQKIKETLESLRNLHERQKVRDKVDGDIDILLKYEKYDKVYMGLTQVRNSQIVGVFRYEIQPGIDEDVRVSFLMRQYLLEDGGGDIPDFLLLSGEISDSVFLDFLHEKKIIPEYPQIGPKKSLLDFTMNQIREYAYKKEMSLLEQKTLTREHMANVLRVLGYPVPDSGEIIFECYDISHTDGHFTYASRVVISNGKPDKSRYKKYKIKTLQDGDIDDFASHREVMLRRTLEGFELGNFPHLIIIDGGKGQLSCALSGVKEGIWKYDNESPRINKVGRTGGILNEGEDKETSSGMKVGNILQEKISHISICSIAKREEEIFLPGKKDPIIFEKGSPELMVIQKARDESHRFSLGANKSARMKSMKKNILEEIPGIGPTTRKKLLKIAGSIDEIKNIEPEEIEKLVTKTQLQSLKNHGIY